MRTTRGSEHSQRLGSMDYQSCVASAGALPRWILLRRHIGVDLVGVDPDTDLSDRGHQSNCP